MTGLVQKGISCLLSSINLSYYAEHSKATASNADSGDFGVTILFPRTRENPRVPRRLADGGRTKSE